jgi:glycosyltransferase involved in cell wall biosynthesis
LRIAVNTRLLQKHNLEGIGRFTFETLQRMVLSHPEVEFIFCFDRPFDPTFVFAKNVKPIVIGLPARHPFLYYLWFEYALPKALKQHKVNILLSPDGFLPLKSSVKTLAIIHDLAFEHYPYGVSWLTQKYYKHFFPLFAQKADKIVTVSEFSKHDLEKTYGINPSKIDVVYNGVSAVFKPLTAVEKTEIKSKLQLQNPYFLYHGSIHPRKNIITLLKAFELFKNQNKTNHQLILIGRKAWKTKELDVFYEQMKYKNEVHFLGKQSDNKLAQVLACADASIYPSYFEGFGLPVIEAFACGVPVITSKNTAMEEIAAGAAYLFDAFNIDDLEKQMVTLIDNPSKTEENVQKGLQIAAQYKWDKVAQKLWDSILKIKPC